VSAWVRQNSARRCTWALSSVRRAEKCGTATYPWSRIFAVRSSVAWSPLAGEQVTDTELPVGTNAICASTFFSGISS
jgi:hypothetical protein